VIKAAQKYGWRLRLAGFLLAGTCFAQTWGSVSGGYIYQVSETPNGHWVSFNGWYGLGTYNITKQVSLFGDFPNFYAPGATIFMYSFLAFPMRSAIKRGLRLSSLSALILSGIPTREP
jgi:hypothetical protein